MRMKCMAAVAASILMSTSLFAMPVFAHSDEPAESAQSSETISESAAPTKEPELSQPLTPEGNMTIVDDLGTTEKSGKQFITLTTKNGNYFYLIIDRDDQGNNTVHFLNQVDEEDLLSLMDEDDVKAYEESKAALAAEKQAEEEKLKEEAEPSDTVEVPEVKPAEETNQKSSKLPYLIALIAGLGAFGAIGAVLYTKNKKKDRKDNTPDPDADYMEDEDEIDLPEEDEEENQDES